MDVRQAVFARVFLGCWLSCAAKDARHALVFGLNTLCVPVSTVDPCGERKDITTCLPVLKVRNSEWAMFKVMGEFLVVCCFNPVDLTSPVRTEIQQL